MRSLLAVLGEVERAKRSLSPLIHGAAAAALGLDVAYVPVGCTGVAHFERVVAALAELGALGANVTIPHKLDALRLATRATDRARAIGAANTLTFEPGGIEADNTDGPALARIIAALPVELTRRAAIFGSGGAARAAAWALREVGAETLVIARNAAAAGEVAALAGGRVGAAEDLAGTSLIVHALPGGAPAAVPWDRAAALLDLNYAQDPERMPLGGPTPLVEEARARGIRAQDGREMLVEQGALSLARWTGADPEAIRAPMRAALGLHLTL